MFRTAISLMVVLLLPAALFADKQKDAEKKAREAQIKALEEQIKQLRQQEKTQLKQIEDQFKTLIAKRGKDEGGEKYDRGRIERDEKETLKRIDERFHYTIQNLEPKQVHQQLEDGLRSLHHVNEVLTRGDWDFGGHRHATVLAVRAAEQQLKRALEHERPEERAQAGKDLDAAHEQMEKALAHVADESAQGKKVPAGLAEAAKELAQEMPVLDKVHHLLQAVDHEIKDLEREKRELLKQRDSEKMKTREQFEARIKNHGQELHHQGSDAKELQHKLDEERKKVKDETAAKIKELENNIKQLKK